VPADGCGGSGAETDCPGAGLLTGHGEEGAGPDIRRVWWWCFLVTPIGEISLPYVDHDRS